MGYFQFSSSFSFPAQGPRTQDHRSVVEAVPPHFPDPQWSSTPQHDQSPGTILLGSRPTATHRIQTRPAHSSMGPATGPFPPRSRKTSPAAGKGSERALGGRGSAQWDAGNWETPSPFWEV